MKQQYQTLKEEAEIYEQLTGQRPSLYHNQLSYQWHSYKLPKARGHRRIMTEAEELKSDQRKYKRSCNVRERLKKVCMGNSTNKGEIFAYALEQGIRIGVLHEEAPQIQRAIKYGHFSKTPAKVKTRPEQFTPKLHYSHLKKKSEGSLNPEHIQLSTPFNTVSNPSILNSQSESIPFPISQTKQVNFLTLNKSNIINYKAQPKTDVLSSAFTRQLIGKTKRQRLILQHKNKEEQALQQQIRLYHWKTKSVIEQMKSKYHLTFTKGKKLSPKKQQQASIFSKEPSSFSHTFLIMNEEAAKQDQLEAAITKLDKAYKNSKNRLEEVESAIRNNEFHQFLEQEQEQLPAVKEDESEEGQDSYRQKVNIIERLKESLIKLKQRPEDDAVPAQLRTIKVNQRLRGLLFT